MQAHGDLQVWGTARNDLVSWRMLVRMLVCPCLWFPFEYSLCRARRFLLFSFFAFIVRAGERFGVCVSSGEVREEPGRSLGRKSSNSSGSSSRRSSSSK